MLYEKGETLVPHEDFFMDDDGFDEERERAFTKGLSYIILDVVTHDEAVYYNFIDDQSEKHYMDDDSTAGWLLQL